ncbi:hypothetical protein D3C87_1790360 [compost metagenome]
MKIRSRRCPAAGRASSSDSNPMWPASRTPTAAPSMVTYSTSSSARLSAQVGVLLSTCRPKICRVTAMIRQISPNTLVHMHARASLAQPRA